MPHKNCCCTSSRWNIQQKSFRSSHLTLKKKNFNSRCWTPCIIFIHKIMLLNFVIKTCKKNVCGIPLFRRWLILNVVFFFFDTSYQPTITWLPLSWCITVLLMSDKNVCKDFKRFQDNFRELRESSPSLISRKQRMCKP